MCRRENVYDHLMLVATHSAWQVVRKPSLSAAIKANVLPFTLKQ